MGYVGIVLLLIMILSINLSNNVISKEKELNEFYEEKALSALIEDMANFLPSHTSPASITLLNQPRVRPQAKPSDPSKIILPIGNLTNIDSDTDKVSYVKYNPAYMSSPDFITITNEALSSVTLYPNVNMLITSKDLYQINLKPMKYTQRVYILQKENTKMRGHLID